MKGPSWVIKAYETISTSSQLEPLRIHISRHSFVALAAIFTAISSSQFMCQEICGAGILFNISAIGFNKYGIQLAPRNSHSIQQFLFSMSTYTSITEKLRVQLFCVT